MHNDLLDILAKSQLPISNEQLVNYLTGKMSDDERHALEKVLLDSDMDNEAMEGLDMILNKERLPQYQQEITRKLREKLHQKNNRPLKRQKVEMPWSVTLTIGILLLILLAWLIIYLLNKS